MSAVHNDAEIAPAQADATIGTPDQPQTDPLLDSYGRRPSIKDVVRLGAGFTISLIITGIVWVSLSSILVPQLVDQIAPRTA